MKVNEKAVNEMSFEFYVLQIRYLCTQELSQKMLAAFPQKLFF